MFLLLWEQDQWTVSDIGECLLLESSTLTPLLKRLEHKGYISRSRSANDERNVLIELTEKVKALKEEARQIPDLVVNSVKATTLTEADVIHLKHMLDAIEINPHSPIYLIVYHKVKNL